MGQETVDRQEEKERQVRGGEGAGGHTEGDSDLLRVQDLANLSRTHVPGNSQVEQIFDIFDCGGDSVDGRIDFNRFYRRVVTYMMEGDNLDTRGKREGPQLEEEEDGRVRKISCSLTPSSVQGVFNENLRRSFDKATSSPVRSPGRKIQKNRRKSSQVRLSGCIPLVNTSSEEEDLEDSFDRKIAASLEVARPMDLQPQFLVRGAIGRNSTIRKSSSSLSSSMKRRSSTASSCHLAVPSLLPGVSPIVTTCPVSGFSSTSSLNSVPVSSGEDTSPQPVRKELYEDLTSHTRFMIVQLERTVGELTETAISRQEDEYDSPSSGVGSLKVDLEEEISASIQLARRHGEERLEVERTRHREQLEAIERERDMERRNTGLRFEQLQEERDRLKKEVEHLKEKVRLIHGEKESCEEQMAELLEEQRCRQQKQEQEQEQDREQELLQTLEHLTHRVEQQDSQLAQAKEDNIVLRSQVKSLKEAVTAAKGKDAKFRIFKGNKQQGDGQGTGQETGHTGAGHTGEDQDPADLRAMLAQVRSELADQKEVNNQIREYMGDILINIMANNPNMLERQ